MTQLLLAVLDPLLCWLLFLPPGGALAVVGAGTGLVVVLIRRWGTDQDLLQRCRDDRRRLSVLVREANGRKDGAAVRRHRRVASQVAMRALRQEGLPFLLSVPVVLPAAAWCRERLAHLPPAAGAPVVIEMRTTGGKPGRVAHIVPIEGARSERGWVRPLVACTEEPGTYRASWTLRLPASPTPHRIEVRSGQGGYSLPLLVGRRIYTSPSRHRQGDDPQVTATLEPVRLFGILPGIPAVGLAPWLTGYLLATVTAALGFRRFLGIR